jgi:TetR/AcrR family transcriptional regulator
MSTTEEKILNAAIKEFSEYGFAGARIDRIAKIAKINKAMIYYHYKSKEKLYEAILSIHTDGIQNFVKNVIPDGKADINQIYTLIAKFIDYLNGFGPEFIKIMLGEFASGGKYIRKFIFPKLIGPMSSLIIESINREIERKTIKPIHPYYTFQQIIGSIIFFNIMRVAFIETPLHDILYSGNYQEDFRDNLIEIIKHGIELKENA